MKQLARARGVSEAEIVRQAIEHEAAGASQQPLAPDRSAWEEILDFVETRKAGSSGPPYGWSRQNAYQE